MNIKQSSVAMISRPALVLSLIGALAACVENPEDGEVEPSDDLGTATAELATRSVVASNGSRSITCKTTAKDPYRFGSLVYGPSSVVCDKFVSNIALKSYLNRGGFLWKNAYTSRQDITLNVTASGGCSGTSIYRTEAEYTITFPSGYTVVSGSRSGRFKSDGTPTISC